MTNRELAIMACKTFVCPNISLIDIKGKELQLKDTTIKRAKDIAIKYFKKTYKNPRYSSAKRLLPSFVHIASVLEGDRRFQSDVVSVFGSTNVTIKKWNEDIIDVLNIEMPSYSIPKKIHIPKDSEFTSEFTCPDLGQIDRLGNILKLKDGTIDKAKELSFRYFKATYLCPRYDYVENVYPALIYTASIIKNDKRRQIDISIISGISEGTISRFHQDILKTLGLKVIYGYDRKVLSIEDSEEKNESSYN